jgi:hypothetical protein
MSEDNKPSDDGKIVPIAEVLISTGLKMAQEQEMSLGELTGHFEIAKLDMYRRVTAGAQAQHAAQNSGPVGDVGTEGEAGASPAEDADKA